MEPSTNLGVLSTPSVRDLAIHTVIEGNGIQRYRPTPLDRPEESKMMSIIDPRRSGSFLDRALAMFLATQVA